MDAREYGSGNADADAQYREGEQHYRSGDPAESVRCFLFAAERGHAEAQYRLGCCHYYGWGMEKVDPVEAEKWFAKAAEQGHAEALYKLGEICENQVKEYTKAELRRPFFDLLLQSLFNLIFKVGSWTAHSEERAAEYYRKASEQGHPGALYRLGEMYRSGIGVKRDVRQAAECYRKAAEQGHAEALYRLGECHRRGKGVDKDLLQAVECYRKAAEKGNKDAMAVLKRIGY